MKKNLRNKRTKIDIANERDLKKRELEEILSTLKEDETVSAETQEQIDLLEDEIIALEEELEAAPQPEPVEDRHIRVVGARGLGEEKRFSVLRAIKNVAENRSHDNLTQAVLDAGRSQLAGAGIAPVGQIIIPEQRAGEIGATLSQKGLETIATEKLDLIGPLYQGLCLEKVGCTFLTGLVSDLSIPVYTGTTTNWEGEVTEANNGSGTFNEIKLRPKRLTAYLDISQQFLLQDSTSAEALLRSDIIESIRQKLEKTLLGAEAGSTTQPAGLFHVPAGAEKRIVYDYAGVLAAEMNLLENNASPKYYLASPLGYSNLRQIAKPESLVADQTLNIAVGGSIVDSNTVSGIPLVVSSNVFAGDINIDAEGTTALAGGYIVGDFSNYVIAQWGNIDLIVDPYTRATSGCVRLVVNAYFDAALKRPSLESVFSFANNPVPPEPDPEP